VGSLRRVSVAALVWRSLSDIFCPQCAVAHSRETYRKLGCAHNAFKLCFQFGDLRQTNYVQMWQFYPFLFFCFLFLAPCLSVPIIQLFFSRRSWQICTAQAILVCKTMVSSDRWFTHKRSTQNKWMSAKAISRRTALSTTVTNCRASRQQSGFVVPSVTSLSLGVNGPTLLNQLLNTDPSNFGFPQHITANSSLCG
jgi:hypothetical protein